MMSWIENPLVKRILDRDVLPSEQGAIETLNDLPDWMLTEARAIALESRLWAVHYLQFYVVKQSRSTSVDFVEEVLCGDKAAQTWRVENALLFSASLRGVERFNIQIFDELSGLDGERWFRLRLNSGDHLSDELPGMIGVLCKDVRYWHQLPAGIDAYRFSNLDDVEAVFDHQLVSGSRRWLARRLAWWAWPYISVNRELASREAILSAVASRIKIGASPEDLAIAAEALRQELLAWDLPDLEAKAGYLGPDDWYA